MNWSERAHRGRTLGLIVGALAGPVTVVAVYLAAAPWIVPAEWLGGGFVAALLLGIVTGLVCAVQLPESAAGRTVLAVLYVPATGSGLMLLWAVAEKLSSGS